jgi:hypothetical protein
MLAVKLSAEKCRMSWLGAGQACNPLFCQHGFFPGQTLMAAGLRAERGALCGREIFFTCQSA